MNKLAALLSLLLWPVLALGQTGAYSGHTFVGGVPATTSGMKSSNYMDGIIPGASITVYLTGTTTKATIYKDGSNTPLSNPFFSNLANGTNPGGFIFWSALNQGLDIQAQGGMGNASCTTSPLCYTTATTLQVDVYPNNSFSPQPSPQLNCTGTGSSQVCTFPGTVVLGSDLPTGHQAASANAAVTTLSVLAFGAKADEISATASYSSGATQFTCSACTFTSADVGKSVVFTYENSTVFSTGPPYVTQITSVIDATHAGIGKTFASTDTAGVEYGTDDVPAAAACGLAANAVRGTCTFPAGQYLMASAPYTMLWGAYDDGAYGQPAGGSGAVLSCSISGGSLTGCTVSNPGSGYTINSALQVNFYVGGGCGTQTYSDGPCGWAWAHANTNSSGQVASVTIIYPGQNFVTAPTPTVTPLGGDGATATATVSAGSVNSTTVTAGGSGYPASVSTIQVFGSGGTGCATIGGLFGAYPVTFTGTATTNSSGQVTTITTTNAGSGCSTAPTLSFGPVGCGTSNTQCSNVAPLDPIRVPVQIPNYTYTSWQGVGAGAFLIGTWDGEAADINQAVMFGADEYGTVGAFQNLSIGQTFVGIGVPWISDSYYNNLSFWQDGIGIQVGIGYDQSPSGPAGLKQIYAQTTFAPLVEGGSWSQRQDSYTINGGYNNSPLEDQFLLQPSGHSAYTDALDAYFANNFWHPEFSTTTNSLETCAYPQTPNPRQTNPPWSYNGAAKEPCYPGVTGSALLELKRLMGGNDAHNISNLGMRAGFRYLYYGNFSSSTGSSGSFTNAFGDEGGDNYYGTHQDPYSTAAVQKGGVLFVSSLANFKNINWTSPHSIQSLLWQIGVGTPNSSNSWQGIVCPSCTAMPAALTQTYFYNLDIPVTTLLNLTYTNMLTNYTMADTDGVVDVYGSNLTLTLPNPNTFVNRGPRFIVNHGLTNLTITASGGAQFTGFPNNYSLPAGGICIANHQQYYQLCSELPINLTTTGTSGAATYNVSTGALNIPQYAGGSTTWPTFTGLAKYGGSSNWVTPTYADVAALWTSCTGYLSSDGTCSTLNICPGLDRTGTTPIATTLLACLASSSEVDILPGTYNSVGLVLPNAANQKIMGIGMTSQQGTAGAVVFQSNCPSGAEDVMEVNPATYNNLGTEIDNIEFYDTSSGGSAGSCRSGLHIVQTGNVILNNLSFLNFPGKTATGTLTFGSGSPTVAGTGFTAAMSPVTVQLGGVNFTGNETNTTTLTLDENYYGIVSSPATGVVHWNGAGLLLDGGGGSNWTQYVTISNLKAQSVLYPVRTTGNVSAVTLDSMEMNCSRPADGIGVLLAPGNDTTKASVKINNCSLGVQVDRNLADDITVRIENDGTQSVVSTCNGGVASINCVNGVYVGGDTASATWGNVIHVQDATAVNAAVLLGTNAKNTTVNIGYVRSSNFDYVDNGVCSTIVDPIASKVCGTLTAANGVTVANGLTVTGGTQTDTLQVGSSGTPTLINVTAMTVAALQALSIHATGDQREVSDGASASDCSTGLGTIMHWCYWNGSSWISPYATAYTLPTQYKQWSCQPGLGDGLNGIAAGTYLQTECMNTTGTTVTLTGLKCYVDGGSASTMNASGNGLGALLTGPVTCSSSFAAGMQSANVLLTNGDYIKFTFVADGASKQSTWVITGTY